MLRCILYTVGKRISPLRISKKGAEISAPFFYTNLLFTAIITPMAIAPQPARTAIARAVQVTQAAISGAKLNAPISTKMMRGAKKYPIISYSVSPSTFSSAASSTASSGGSPAVVKVQ